MLVRRLVVSLGVAAVGVALLAVPSYADAPTDVYVANGGSDANFPTCSQALPCATVPAALNAVADGGTIHVGTGTFDGWVNLGARGIAVTILGDSAQGTILTASSASTSGYDGTVVEAYADVPTTLEHLTVSGDGDDAGVFAYNGTQLGLDDVVVDGGDCAVAVFNAAVDLTDSTLQHGGGGSCTTGVPVSGDLGFGGGTVNMTRTQILDPAVGAAGVEMQGGTLTADQSFFDDSLDTNNSKGLHVTAGTATVTRSTFHNWAFQAVDVDGGSTTLSDDTFQGNLVGVNGDGGSTTVLRSTFEHEGGSLQGTVSVAGSVLGSVLDSPPSGFQECNGTITDLGYNLATDHTCAFTATTSKTVSQIDLNLTDGIDDWGGPVHTVAIRNPSVAVDTIPSGATYGNPAAPLCPATGTTDLRGVPRPVGGACDAGSMEMVATTTTVTGPAKAKPHQDVTFEATVTAPDVVAGTETPTGSVTFTSGGNMLCAEAPLQPAFPKKAFCATEDFGAGKHTVTATYVPAVSSTIHASVSRGITVRVGTKPKIKAPGKVVVRVGRKASVKLKASGQPTPVLVLSKGHLPKGLSFHKGKGKASITGRAKTSAVGTYHLKVKATNLMGKTTHRLTLVVKRS